GTVTDLVDTGSDLSYFAAHDEFIHQNASAGFNLRWEATDSLDVEFDAHHSYANSDGGVVGTNNFGIIGQNPQLALTKTFHMGSSTIPTTSWIYKSPYTTSNLDTSTIDPLFGQSNTTAYYNVIDEARINLLWKNKSADSGLRSIEVG